MLIRSACVGAALVVVATSFPVCSRAQTFRDVYDFATGAAPNEYLLFQGGQLYGKSEFGGAKDRGFVFSVDPLTGIEKDLVELTNPLSDPNQDAGLAYYNGSLYATTFGNKAYRAGLIYKVSLKSDHANVVAGFPGTMFVEPNTLFKAGSLFYGTTKYGGSFDDGILFSFNPATKAITVLYNFGASEGQPGPVLSSANGVVYGVTYHNSVFAYDIASGTMTSPFATLDDVPSSGVIYRDGYLYGTAGTSNSGDNGEIYRVDAKSGQVSVLYRFQGGNDGLLPISLLTTNGDFLYGTTYMGGSANGGTAFAFNLKTNSKRILYNFGENGAPNGYPESNLIWNAGSFYGLCYTGGANGSGLIYAITP